MELLRDRPGVRSAAMFGQSLHLTLAGPGLERELHNLLLDGGINVRGIHALEPSLEDVFIDLSSNDHVN